MGYIVLAIVVLVVLAGVTLLTAMRRNDANRAIGELSRETKKRDRDVPSTDAPLRIKRSARPRILNKLNAHHEALASEMADVRMFV